MRRWFEHLSRSIDWRVMAERDQADLSSSPEDRRSRYIVNMLSYMKSSQHQIVTSKFVGMQHVTFTA